jgi:hypothetical protein
MITTTFFPKYLAYRFSTLLIAAGCYPFKGFVITDAKVLNYLKNDFNFSQKKSIYTKAPYKNVALL